MTMGCYYGDKWDPDNDWSYKDLTIYDEDDAFFGTGNEVRTDYICVYSDGVLIGGIEPDGSVPDTETPSEKPTEETTEKPTEKPTQPANDEKLLYGDADCSGAVDILDVIALNRALLGSGTLTELGKKQADVDLDGTPKSADSLIIMKYVVKLVAELPVK